MKAHLENPIPIVVDTDSPKRSISEILLDEVALHAFQGKLTCNGQITRWTDGDRGQARRLYSHVARII